MISVTCVDGSLIINQESILEKTKQNPLFGTKCKLRKAGKLNITYQGIDIKQNSQVTYLGYIFDETMSGERMAYKTIKKTNLTKKSTF